jgi:hypothetical protein
LQVSLHGGQVVSWRNDRGEELLFTSSKVNFFSLLISHTLLLPSSNNLCKDSAAMPFDLFVVECSSSISVKRHVLNWAAKNNTELCSFT